jgi:hypothetical protein
MTTDQKEESEPTLPLGADYVYRCGCYWFCGNAVACAKHSPYAWRRNRPQEQPDQETRGVEGQPTALGWSGSAAPQD